jgi:elongation factor P--(R)-beta-lysine ligase
MSWQPSATIDTLVKRAAFIARIREFFKAKQVLEVETPALSAASVTDVNLHAFVTEFNNPLTPVSQELYLQTSPEYAMKRLLCAGSGAIFQICRAFRNEEAGRYHNPEFTLLEWYRPGFNHVELMDEIDELVQMLLACHSAERISYQHAFKQHLKFDPLDTSIADLREIATAHGFAEIAETERDPDVLLQLLFSHIIEPLIGQRRPCFVYNFPATQAALARISKDDGRVAERFELYYKGIELANGFHELQDAEEQRQRFLADNFVREQKDLPTLPIDNNLLAALSSGLPDCAGVAIGIDRLFMLAVDKVDIAEVLAFPVNKA